MRLDMCATRENKNRIRNTKNRIFAMLAAAIATPPNPRIAAINATTKNVKAQYSMWLSSPCSDDCKFPATIYISCFPPSETTFVQKVRYRVETKVIGVDIGQDS